MTTLPSQSRDAASSPDKKAKSPNLIVLLVGVLCLLVALLYSYRQTRLPSAAAHVLRVNEQAWRDNGAVLVAIGDHASQGRLQEGDVLLAVEGKSLAQSAKTIALGRSHLSWEMGQTVPMTVLRGDRRLTVEVELRPYPGLAALSQSWSILLFSVSTFVLGAFVLWRRPDNRASRPLFLWGASLLGSMTWALGLDGVQLYDSLQFWLHIATAGASYLLFWMSGLHLGLVFPQRYPVLERRPGAALLVYALGTAAALAVMAYYIIAGDPLAWLYGPLRAVGLVAAPLGLAMIVAVTWGYRTFYTEDSRRRARLFLFTGTLFGSIGLALWLVAPIVIGRVLIPIELAGLLLLPIPIALAVAIVRHRLFDIDVIIRRTLVYTLLTVTLAAIYFASVIILQSLLGAFRGGLSDLAIVLSTLAIATLFSPLRKWIQTAIDRRFYRSKYNAQATVAQFSEAAQSEVDLEALSSELVGLIQETMQPTHISLWVAGEWSGWEPDARE
jgi:hypothetical protein